MTVEYIKTRSHLRASITRECVTYVLGAFDTEAEANAAYSAAVRRHAAGMPIRNAPVARPILRDLPFDVPPAPPHRSSASRVPLLPKHDPEKEASA